MSQDDRLVPSSTASLDTIRRVYAFWGCHPALYTLSDYVTFLGRPAFIRSRAVQALGRITGTRILDLGCGTGRNLPSTREAVGEKGVILGLDYSADMLAAASELIRRKSWNNVRLLQGDAARSIIRNQTIDGILSVLAVSAIPAWRDALARCFDMLRPGGTISVCDACLFQGVLSVLNPLIRTLFRRFAAWDPSRNIPDEMQRIFGNVPVVRYNLGTFFVAQSVKP